VRREHVGPQLRDHLLRREERALGVELLEIGRIPFPIAVVRDAQGLCNGNVLGVS
jgi:hypothetical protein